MRSEPGQIINGKYRLLHLIGEGGMGSVFAARHEYLGTDVALKFLAPELGERPGLIARFLQEARVSASIRSPYVVQVIDVDQSSDGLPYMVMELLEGETLQRHMNRVGRLSLPVALDFAIQILNGLEAAHAKGIVHRDLKPDNVFIVQGQSGQLLKLLDFGIAKLRTEELRRGLTRPGMVMGTPEYMAPEQAFSADTVDHRADIYALGVMLFEMISGKRPVASDDPRIMAAAVLAGNVLLLSDVEPNVPPGLAAVIKRAMAGRPGDRFNSSGELRGALLPFCAISSHAAGISAYPSMAATPTTPPAQRLAATASDRPPPTAPGSDPGQPPGGVTPTLPPEEPDPGGPTGTVLAPPLTPQLAAQMAEGFGGGARERYSPPQAPLMTAPPRRPSRRTLSWVGVAAAVSGAAAVAAVIAFVAMQEGRDEDMPPISPTAPPTTITSPVSPPATQPPPATPATTPTVPPPPPMTTTVRPPPRADAGAQPDDAGARQDAALPFPFPSGIPSGLIPPFPPMPSGLPTFPPIPGWPPPP